VLGGRSTHFCSWCQRLPKPEQAAAALILKGMEPKPGRRFVAEDGSEIRRGPRWSEIGGSDGALGIPTGSTRRAAGPGRIGRAEQTRKAAATRRAAARASQVARPDSS
jgi:hypothetical protein